MDGVSPQQLYARLGSASAPPLVDVRREDAFNADDAMIIGAVRRVPESTARWLQALPKGREIIVYCGDGQEVSQNIARTLQNCEITTAFLEGGIADWKAQGLPTRRKRDGSENKWVTREHPKIDRIACPWLISRFVNPEADFIYVPPNDVAKVAAEVGGTPYDIKGVEFGHVGERCSFDAIVRAYDIHDAALDRLAIIVRGADTSRSDLSPQCEGLLAISHGLSANFPDDHEMLKHGMVIYDALYTWCRRQSHGNGAR
jgi:rhodanese-related sulfurtransferase